MYIQQEPEFETRYKRRVSLGGQGKRSIPLRRMKRYDVNRMQPESDNKGLAGIDFTKINAGLVLLVIVLLLWLITRR